jgi:hypothetical protein
MKKEKIVMISQPRYLPFIPYLHRIKKADVFIVMNHVQRVERGYENRNRMLCNGKSKWVTIPVFNGGRCLIEDSTIQYGIGEGHKKLITDWYLPALKKIKYCSGSS